MMRTSKIGISAALCLGLLEGMSRDAHACGGFFCSQVPVDQTGEQIIFSVAPNHVTAHIQINYSGSASDFAWVVPVQAKPEITLGSRAVFQAVGGLTQPQFRIEWGGDGGFCGGVLNDRATAGGVPPTAGGVTVVDASEVGPYQTVTLESHDSQQLIDWLNENGFVQPAEALPLIDHYVRLNMLFVALRLKQSATVGEIQPVVLDMATQDPCVPLILTQIAAQPDMPVQVYVLGTARAVPDNWFNVVPDLARINWLNFGSNYRQVVTNAINQAAGHGFVTEFAGSSALMKDVIWKPGRYDTAGLRTITDPAALVQALLSAGFPRDATMQALLRKWIPMPASVSARGVTEQQFYNNLSAYRADLDAAGFVLDAVGFANELDERVVLPLQHAQAMFDTQPYLTRMLSTVSPAEMTRDPLFVLNPSLPDVSNVHVAKAFGMCLPDGTVGNLTLQLEDGQVLGIDGNTRFYGNTPWPYTAGSAARRVELIGPTGAPITVQPADIVAIDRALDSTPSGAVRGMVPAAPTGNNADGCGCGVGPGRGGGAAFWLGLAAAVLGVAARRRRRRS
jgi:MYXO-CTERM domain-containing protein